MGEEHGRELLGGGHISLGVGQCRLHHLHLQLELDIAYELCQGHAFGRVLLGGGKIGGRYGHVGQANQRHHHSPIVFLLLF